MVSAIYELRSCQCSSNMELRIVDCSPLLFATEICSGGDAQAACFDQKKMRRHLSMCLRKGVMKLFPKGTSEPFPCPTERLSTYRVYCHCRLLEEFDHKMVECTQCKSWYHVTCVGLCQKEVPVHWKCDKCSNKYSANLFDKEDSVSCM